MDELEVLRDGGYRDEGVGKIKLTYPLDEFPTEILELGWLEHVDLSGTGLSSLPSDIGSRLPKLRIAFSNCKFTSFPKELASCPSLEMVGFRNNGMITVPEDAFPRRLRWLMLMNNRIARLPASIGQCTRLQKCMLAGNRLRCLPENMSRCQKVGLLRLSANLLKSLPGWLFSLPELAFLSLAGNPCVSPKDGAAATELIDIPWTQLTVGKTVGQGASGIISRGEWLQTAEYAEEVAIKLFRSVLTSDGMASDEMAACLAAGCHESLIAILGRVCGHPEGEKDGTCCGGIVMQLVPTDYVPLGNPPSFERCTRDTFAEDTARLDARRALAVLQGVAGAAAHLHARGIAHGDLYAHNVLVRHEDVHALLGHLGAATVYGGRWSIERLEILAFAHLMEHVMNLLVDGEVELRKRLRDLHARCAVFRVEDRPMFVEMAHELETMMGWRGMMRLPG